ncbi:aspartate kinase [Macrococcus epidermidis]|uniref:Aspartokinase n=1 Tax=Macrococcus epidermidis TaxID=1902580 RepID=A0A327ZYI2_9STAP|nr:aspartate kinase [Macrococcus epidermidis]MCG7419969.1 aspartate kinase [Macrococcus epidermidis]RAK46594.1 aspartate kinase [Macrococcus epidermidis]UTH17389.1 aspartate kinase [Macrococcus epidermidis]
MIVCKFGGSSVANAQQIRKILNIINQNDQRKIVIVSAPGKRYAEDVKVTDLLIQLYDKVLLSEKYDNKLNDILHRFESIEDELGLTTSLTPLFKTQLLDFIQKYNNQPLRLLDALKSSGEDFNAQLIAAYNNQNGIKTTYLSPKALNMIVSDEPGNAIILDDSYEKIYKVIQNIEGKIIIPGFFGVNENGDRVTFSRGGSDITGAIISRSVHAEIYENFTDVSGIFAANPNIVENPASIHNLTYAEMRELSYAGFNVFHDEALMPLYKEGIPVNIKNTNDPDHPGTMITKTRASSGVVGVSCDSGFVSINMTKYLMNREIGFTRKLLTILESNNISYEHMPSGIDDISLIIRKNQFNDNLYALITEIKNQLNVDDISVEENIAILMIVGLGMKTQVGTANKATEAFRRNNINLKMINQGSSEISMMFGIDETDERKAVQAIYDAYFTA